MKAAQSVGVEADQLSNKITTVFPKIVTGKDHNNIPTHTLVVNGMVYDPVIDSTVDSLCSEDSDIVEWNKRCKQLHTEGKLKPASHTCWVK